MNRVVCFNIGGRIFLAYAADVSPCTQEGKYYRCAESHVCTARTPRFFAFFRKQQTQPHSIVSFSLTPTSLVNNVAHRLNSSLSLLSKPWKFKLRSNSEQCSEVSPHNIMRHVELYNVLYSISQFMYSSSWLESQTRGTTMQFVYFSCIVLVPYKHWFKFHLVLNWYFVLVMCFLSYYQPIFCFFSACDISPSHTRLWHRDSTRCTSKELVTLIRQLSWLTTTQRQCLASFLRFIACTNRSVYDTISTTIRNPHADAFRLKGVESCVSFLINVFRSFTKSSVHNSSERIWCYLFTVKVDASVITEYAISRF